MDDQGTEMVSFQLAEAAGEHLSVDVLLVHAQDHLMCSMLAQELVQELICLYECTATKNA